MSSKKQPRSKIPRKTHYTITEAAKKLGISRTAVHEAICKGRLDAKKGKIFQTQILKVVRYGWRIPAKALANYRVSLPHQRSGKKIISLDS